MTTDFSLDKIQNLLFFPLKAPDGKKKLLIACLLGLSGFVIPILPSFILLGYSGLIMRRIIHEKAEPFMPEWQDWGEMLSLGAKMGGATMIYSLPAFFLIITGYFAMMVPAFLDAIASGGHSYAPAPLTGFAVFGMFGGMACMGLGMLLSLTMWAFIPPMLSHVVATNSFKAAFHFKDWLKILRVNLGGFVITMILLGGLYMLMIFALQILYMTIVLCIVVPFLMSFITAYLVIIAGVLFAQAYREGIEKLDAQKA